MKILIICPLLPVPPDSGGSIRSLNIIKALSINDDLYFIGINYNNVSNNIDYLKNFCKEVFLVPWSKKSKWRQVPDIIKKIIIQEPFDTKYSDFIDIKEYLYNITGNTKYDIIIIEHSINANLINYLHPQHQAKTVLSMHNTAYIQIHRMYRFENNICNKFKLLLTWFPMKKWEPKMSAMFDKIISVSESDKKFLLQRNSELDIDIIPNGVDTKKFKVYPLEKRKKNILIVGALDYLPNTDGVLYFCKKIFPIIKTFLDDCTLTIVGRNPPPEILRLDDEPTIFVKGNVDDVRPYYQEALVAAVPIRSGGGTRLKILEAMATGTPVVTTSLGCEGIDVKNNFNILMADDPAIFAESVINLIKDETLWKRISQEGRTLVEKHYDWETIGMNYRKMLINLISSK